MPEAPRSRGPSRRRGRPPPWRSAAAAGGRDRSPAAGSIGDAARGFTPKRRATESSLARAAVQEHAQREQQRAAQRGLAASAGGGGAVLERVRAAGRVGGDANADAERERAVPRHAA